MGREVELEVQSGGSKDTPYMYHNDPEDNFEGQTFQGFFKNIQGKTKLVEDAQGAKWSLVMDLHGEQRVTTAKLERAYDPKAPTIIFHHGVGMYDNMTKAAIFMLLRQQEVKRSNVISVRAQSFNNEQEFRESAFDTLEHQQAVFAGSVLMIEELSRICERQKSPKAVVGISMGGMIGTWHFLNFDSADQYFPLIAYPDATKVFLGPYYEGKADNRTKRAQMPLYREAFKSEAKDPEQNRGRVHPVLEKKDEIMLYEDALTYWKGYDINSYPEGHKGLLIFRFREISKLIAENVEKETGRETGIME